MSGMLYLCATPIGNLEDITARVLATLADVDIIAAEDTRNTLRLLNHFDIHRKLVSFHEHNKDTRGRELVELMLSGSDIALVTDAGTPAISDPGESLVAMCHEASVPVTSLPGPSAVITALSVSGISARRFVFEGFLPGRGDKKMRRTILDALADEPRTIVLYEAPHHLKALLSDLAESLGGDRRLAICRELTKKFEEIRLTTISEAIDLYDTEDPRGEFVLVIEGTGFASLREKENAHLLAMTVNEHVEAYEKQGLSRKEAMKAAARDRGVSKSDIYKALL